MTIVIVDGHAPLGVVIFDVVGLVERNPEAAF
jgi:hypothetical protein